MAQLLSRAQNYCSQSQPSSLLKNTTVANLFFENSTRTRVSFEVAAKRLGAQVVNFDVDRSSLAKGETLYDTIKTLEALGVNCAIVRHSDDSFFKPIKDNVQVSLVNAGTGKTAHPTQALLDALTIKQHFKSLQGLKIAICGDIKFSRVAASNIKLLSKFGCHIYLCGPEVLMPDNCPYPGVEVAILDNVVHKVDIIMMLRIQLERHEDLELTACDFLEHFGLTRKRANKMKTQSIIMHPGPFNRGVEIDSQLVECAQSKIFEQVKNGVAARMAVLEAILSQGDL